MRKRPFSAIDTSEAPTKHAAPPQNHSQRIITPREAFVRQTAAESSATASHARNLSASQAAQPSKPRQMYNGVAMDPSIILQQAGAMANAAEANCCVIYEDFSASSYRDSSTGPWSTMHPDMFLHRCTAINRGFQLLTCSL